jgi:hypothetical protein
MLVVCRKCARYGSDKTQAIGQPNWIYLYIQVRFSTNYPPTTRFFDKLVQIPVESGKADLSDTGVRLGSSAHLMVGVTRCSG